MLISGFPSVGTLEGIDTAAVFSEYNNILLFDMDTKPLELEALKALETSLLRYGYKFAKLSFDEDGSDIFVIKKMESETSVYWKCLRCQSKGRNVSKHSSNVVIPQDYVREDFLVYVYVKPEAVDDSKGYLFSSDDVRGTWRLNDGNYELYLPKTFCYEHQNDVYLLTLERSAIIEEHLVNVGKVMKDRDVEALTEAEFYFEMWKKTGGLPPMEYLLDVFADDNLDYLAGTEVFIFMLCASVVVNYKNSDCRLSIDWAFLDLKMLGNRTDDFVEATIGESYRSDVAIAYSRTYVQELLSDDGKISGFHLHIADDEESVDARVMRDGWYGVVYKA